MSVNITITIPTDYIDRVSNALNGLANKKIGMSVKDGIGGFWRYDFAPQNWGRN